MSGFTKLFSAITSSSIWNEDDVTRLVWITMLAMADANGVVYASIGGLAHTARVNRDACEMAIQKLESPDPDSRSPEFEGRRIKKIEGGFLLLNYAKYREARSEDERRLYMREYMKEYRKTDVNNRKQKLTRVNRSKPPLAQAEAEAEAENTPKPPEGASKGKKDNLPTSEKAKRLATMFGRKLTTEWSDKEISAFKKIAKQPEEDFDLVEALYKSDYEFLRHDLQTFLNNFTGEVDKARKWKAGKLNGTSRPTSNPRVTGTANANMCQQYSGIGRIEGERPANGTTGP